MRDLLGKARSRVGVAVISAALLTVGGTATAAVLVSSPSTDEVSDVAPATTSQAPPAESEAPAPAEVAPPAVAAVTTNAPAPSVPADTVEPVTEPAPQEPTEGTVVDPESIGSRGSDGHYTPAPPRQNPGEPPVAPAPPPPAPDAGAPQLPDPVS